jgi:hypothetical protein
MENEERSIAFATTGTELLLDHTNCLDELKVLTTGFHPMKICPSLGTDQNLELGCRLPPNYRRFSIRLTMPCRHRSFPKENSMPTFSK